jgi:hypothetical protein
VLAPLFVVAPGKQRWRLLVAAAAAVALVSLPFVVATSGRAIHAVIFGTGDSTSFGGTVLWNTGLRGAGLVFCARILPILVSVAIAWLASRRLGSGVLAPIPLLSLLATCLSLRLIFEEGLFGYKFMALAVLLVMLALVRGRIRGGLVAWLALVTLAFNPIPAGLTINARSWSDHVAASLPLACIVVVLLLIARDAVLRRIRWYLVLWLVVATWAFLHWPLWSVDSIHSRLPLWFWQLVLLSTGFVMAISPLVEAMRDRGAKTVVSPENIEL